MTLKRTTIAEHIFPGRVTASYTVHKLSSLEPGQVLNNQFPNGRVNKKVVFRPDTHDSSATLPAHATDVRAHVRNCIFHAN